MDVAVVLGFWAVVAALVAVPGADWAFVLDAAARGRVRAAVAGLAVGYLGLTAVVAFGVGGLLARSAVVLTTLTVLGACYLVGQGVRTTVRPPAQCLVGDGARGGVRTTVGRGIGVSGLNPKALLMFLAVLPQFADPGAAWPLPGQLATLGTVFVLTVVVFYLGLGALSARVLRRRPRASLLVTRAAGLGMVLVGCVLLLERWACFG